MCVTGRFPGWAEVGVAFMDWVKWYPWSSTHSNLFTILSEFIDHMTTVPSKAPVTKSVSDQSIEKIMYTIVCYNMTYLILPLELI